MSLLLGWWRQEGTGCSGTVASAVPMLGVSVRCPGYLVSLIVSQRCGTEIGMGCPAEGLAAYAVKQDSFVSELQNNLQGLGVAMKPNS